MMWIWYVGLFRSNTDNDTMTVIISSSKAFFNYCQEFEKYHEEPVYLAREVKQYSYLLDNCIKVIDLLEDIPTSQPLIFLDFIWLSEELTLFKNKNFCGVDYILDIYEDFQKKLIEISPSSDPIKLLYHFKWSPALLFRNILGIFKAENKYWVAVKKENFSTINFCDKRSELSRLSTQIKNKIMELMDFPENEQVHIVLNNKKSNTEKETNELLMLKKQSMLGGNWYIKNHPNKKYNQYNDFLNLKTINLTAPSEFFMDEKIKIHPIDSVGGTV